MRADSCMPLLSTVAEVEEEAAVVAVGVVEAAMEAEVEEEEAVVV